MEFKCGDDEICDSNDGLVDIEVPQELFITFWRSYKCNCWEHVSQYVKKLQKYQPLCITPDSM